MGMIEIVFVQYGVNAGICLNLNVTGAPILKPLIGDLSFLYCYFHIGFSSSKFVTYAIECLASQIDLLHLE